MLSVIYLNRFQETMGYNHLLTIRERQVTLVVSEGLSNKQVGQRLSIAEGTVKLHLHNIYRKLAVANRTALAVVALGGPF